MPVNLQELEAYIRGGKFMTLGTFDGTALSSCGVWYAVGSGGISQLIFTSRDSRSHSVNIRAHGNVSGGIVYGPLEGLGQKTKGAFFRGTAREVSGFELDEAYNNYARRWPQVNEIFTIDDIRSGATPMRIYLVNVDEFTFVDEAGNPDDPVARAVAR